MVKAVPRKFDDMDYKCYVANTTNGKCISFIFSCHWPACSTDCSGLTKPQLHGLECKILAMQRGPRPQDTTDPKEFLNFYRSDALMALRCIMLQHYFPDKWMKVQAFESHDQQRIGTKYYE